MSNGNYQTAVNIWKQKYGAGSSSGPSVPEDIVDMQFGTKILGDYYKDQYNQWMKDVNEAEFIQRVGGMDLSRKKYELITPSTAGTSYKMGGVWNPKVKYSSEYRNHIKDSFKTRVDASIDESIGSAWDNTNVTVSINGSQYTGTKKEMLKKWTEINLTDENLSSHLEIYGTDYIPLVKETMGSWVKDNLDIELTDEDFAIYDEKLAEFKGPNSPMEMEGVSKMNMVMNKVDSIQDMVSIAILAGQGTNKKAKKWAKSNLTQKGLEILLQMFPATRGFAQLMPGGKIGKTLMSLLKWT